jgi:hypothetical protein
MRYAKVKDGVVVEYPAHPRKDNPNALFPRDWGGGEIGGSEYVVVEPPTALPTVSGRQRIQAPIPIKGPAGWKAEYQIEEVPAEEVAAELFEDIAGASLSPFQFAEGLRVSKLLSTVTTYCNDPTTPVRLRIWWERARSFPRTSKLMQALAAGAGITDEQLDQVFIIGSDVED